MPRIGDYVFIREVNKATMDARVAKIVGYTLLRYEGRGDGWRGYVACLSPKQSKRSYPRPVWVEITSDDFDSANNRFVRWDTPPPFISAPTDETDGIVLRWVQKQDTEFHIQFFLMAGTIIANRDNNLAGKFYTGLSAMHLYELGDWANALLAVEGGLNQQVGAQT